MRGWCGVISSMTQLRKHNRKFAWRSIRHNVGPVLISFGLAGVSVQSVVAQPTSGIARVATPDAVKAVYLYKFRNYVEWPGGDGKAGIAKTTIGVIGGDDVVDRLQDLSAGRDSANGTVTVKHLRIGDSLEGLSMLYIDDTYWRRAGATVTQAAARSILVVTESPNALNDGSVINFRMVGERVRFEVSLDSAAQSGLKLSSQLLALAVTVVREKRK